MRLSTRTVALWAIGVLLAVALTSFSLLKARADDGDPVLGDAQAFEDGTPLHAPTGMSLIAAQDEPSSEFISAEEALDVAWELEGSPGSPETATAVLAELSWGERYSNLPVWVISLPDACVPLFGPIQTGSAADAPAECAKTPFDTIIDAVSAEFVASYAVSDAGYETVPIG